MWTPLQSSRRGRGGHDYGLIARLRRCRWDERARVTAGRAGRAQGFKDDVSMSRASCAAAQPTPNRQQILRLGRGRPRDRDRCVNIAGFFFFFWGGARTREIATRWRSAAAGAVVGTLVERGCAIAGGCCVGLGWGSLRR